MADDIVLPHYPSKDSLRPEDLKERVDSSAYVEAHGKRNLRIIYALATKENMKNPSTDATAVPFTSHEIVELLSNQINRRRRKVFDDERLGPSLLNVRPGSERSAGPEGAAARFKNRRQEVIIYGENALKNKPLPDQQELPWSGVDELSIEIAAVSDRGDYEYTGRVSRTDEDDIALQIEGFLRTGELPSPQDVNLAFLNGLFGTLHVIHVLASREARKREWRNNVAADMPKDADSLLQAVRDMRLHHSIGPERTKISDLLVCGITGNDARSDTSHLDHLTDTLLEFADNCHENEMLPYRFIALAHKYWQFRIPDSNMYIFPEIDEAKVIEMWGESNKSTHSENIKAYDSVKGFDSLKQPLNDYRGTYQNSIDTNRSEASHSNIGSLDSQPELDGTRDHGPAAISSRLTPPERAVSPKKFPVRQSSPGPSKGKAAARMPQRELRRKRSGLLREIQDLRKEKARLHSPPPAEKEFFSPPPIEKEPQCLRSVDDVFAANPRNAAGPEPFLLSRTEPVVDPKETLTALPGLSYPRRASELPTGTTMTHHDGALQLPQTLTETGMPQEHADKMGLKGDFGRAGITKVPAIHAKLAGEPLPDGPVSTNFPILANMLAEERKEATYARYKCIQAERMASEMNGNAVRYATELEMARKDLATMTEAFVKMKELKELWEARCATWEERYASSVVDHGEHFVA